MKWKLAIKQWLRGCSHYVRDFSEDSFQWSIIFVIAVLKIRFIANSEKYLIIIIIIIRNLYSAKTIKIFRSALHKLKFYANLKLKILKGTKH